MDLTFVCSHCDYATLDEGLPDDHKKYYHEPPEGPNILYDILPELHKETPKDLTNQNRRLDSHIVKRCGAINVNFQPILPTNHL